MTALVLRGFADLRRGLGQMDRVWLLIAVLPLGVALLDPARLGAVLEFALLAFSRTLVFVAVAVTLIGYLKATGAETLVAKAFEGRETRMIVLAALFGGLAPFCSCEVIPFIAGLLAVGAPLPAVMAFWLSSPLIDPPTVVITAGALGWEFGIGKTVAAVTLGLIGGFGMRLLVRHGAFSSPLRPRPGTGCASGCGSPLQGTLEWRFWRDPGRRIIFRTEALANALFLVKWLALAYLLEALLVTYVPAEAIGAVVGGEGIRPIVLGALVGAPAYLNGYAAPALVAGLMEQGMSAGAAMSFLVAGAVTSVPAMAAVWSLVIRRVFLAYLGFGVGGAILIGAVFEVIV